LEHAPLATISPVWITVSECALLSAALLASIVFLQSRSRLWLYIVSVFLLLASTSIAIRLYKIRSNLEIVFFSLPKNKCVIFRKGNQAVAVTSLQTNSKIFRYSVQPYIDSCGVRDIKLIAPGINFHNQYFSIENRTAVFGSHKIKFMDGKDLSDLAGADIYFIDALRGSGGDKYHSFNHFNANETVIIGRVYGSTSNSVESINHPQNIKVLYRNKAVVLPSN
jgi:competence protein ComEC